MASTRLLPGNVWLVLFPAEYLNTLTSLRSSCHPHTRALVDKDDDRHGACEDALQAEQGAQGCATCV